MRRAQTYHACVFTVGKSTYGAKRLDDNLIRVSKRSRGVWKDSVAWEMTLDQFLTNYPDVIPPVMETFVPGHWEVQA